jgi:hypothetical protein
MARKRLVQTSSPAARQAKTLLPTNKAELLERFKDYPAIEAITRRFNDPNDPGSQPILLKDEPANACINSDHMNKLRENAATCHLCKKPARAWVVRWVNTLIEGRWAQIKGKGYVPVEVKDLKDQQDVSDLVRQKDEETGAIYVRRGDRGAEVLCKMPLELYNYLKRAQRATVAARNNSKKAVADDLAESAGAELGDQAGQFIHDGGVKVESMTRTTRTLAEELADDLIEA